MFSPKIDLVGIGDDTNLKLRSNTHGQSNSVLQIPKSDGSIIDDEIYGHISAPNCDYAITGSTQFQKNLGQVYSSNGPYALQSISISTGAGQEPSFSATAV